MTAKGTKHEHQENGRIYLWAAEVSVSAAILSYNAAHACRIWGNDEGRRHGA